jgi:hypothetical protein
METADTWNDHLKEIDRLFRHTLQHTDHTNMARLYLLKFAASSLTSALETLRILDADNDVTIASHYEELKSSMEAYVHSLCFKWSQSLEKCHP